MKKLAIFMSMILALSCVEVSAKHHKKKNIKHEVPSIKAGHSKECGRPKPVTSAEDKRKSPKPNRQNEKKRDRYGASVIQINRKHTKKDKVEPEKPKIVKLPRPREWSEPHDGD